MATSFADVQAAMSKEEGVEPDFRGGRKRVEYMVAYTTSEVLIHSKPYVPHPRFEGIAAKLLFVSF